MLAQKKRQLQCLQAYGLLDDSWSNKLDHIARLSASLTDSDLAAVFIVTDTNIKVMAQVGLSVRTMQAHSAIFDYAIAEPSAFEVTDVLTDERFAGFARQWEHAGVDSSAIADQSSQTLPEEMVGESATMLLRSIASAPILINGVQIGIALIADRQPRQLEARHSEALSDIALLVADKISSGHASNENIAVTVGEQTSREIARLSAIGSRDDSLLAQATHQLRTPLMSILREAGLMNNDKVSPLRPLQRQRLSGLESAGHHMLELLDRLFELSRLEAEPAGTRIGRADVHDVISESVQQVSPLADALGVSVDHERPELDLFVAIDPIALARVMDVVLSNAVSYNQPGGKAQVTVHRSGESVRVRVADTGCGLSQSEIDQLFQPFHSFGHETVAAAGRQNCGLGLSIARSIVQSCNGEISVESDPGFGSVFEIRLPLTH